MSPETRSGLLYGLGAFGLWGLSPLYWHLLDRVPVPLILAHRIVWSAVFLAFLMRGRWTALREALGRPRTAAALAATTSLIGLNWSLYIWAIQNNRVLDSSLGYYVNPLLSVLLGAFVLGERLRPAQAAAFALAAAGVAVLVKAHGHLPLLALSLACSFALYGLLRKLAPVDALAGLTAETFALAAPSLAFLLYRPAGPAAEPGMLLLLAGGAAVTALPLLWFVEAAKRLSLKTIGFLQFTSPTLQFLLAVLVYREPLPPARLAAFGFIWAAVALYTADAWRRPRA